MDTYDNSMAAGFRQLLAQRETELRATLHAANAPVDASGQAEPREVTDFKDVATELSRATIDDAKAEHAAKELELLLAARARLDDASFGYCLDCGEAIDLRRLQALPTAPLCTACQSIQEHGRPLMTRQKSLTPP